jgi:hypothetical protein
MAQKEKTMGLLSGLLGNASVLDETKLQEDYGQFMTETEKIELGFQVLRDTFVFTDKRLILVDKQGLRGKKVEYLSIPYSKITKFSIENAGTFDLDAELKIWVGSEPIPIQKKFNKTVNIYDIQKLLATHILG